MCEQQFSGRNHGATVDNYYKEGNVQTRKKQRKLGKKPTKPNREMTKCN